MSTLSIRKAIASDLLQIAQFIRDLAVYEKLSHQVSFDESRLQQELFGDAPVAHVLMAEWDSAPVGFALYFYNFSTFLGKRGIYLEDLYVDPSHRGKSIGKSLLKELARLAVAQDCGRLEWQVLDWNEPSIAFYDSLGAKQKSDWITYQLTDDALRRLAEQH